jgi:hypothetical protein
MLNRSVILPALVLLLAEAPAWADQFSANAQSGGAQMFASLETGAGTVSYGIVTGGIGNITGAMILQGSSVFVNLGASSSTGSASGTVQTSANLNLLNDTPAGFSLQVNGQSGSITAPIVETAGGGGPTGPCEPGDETLCLTGGRFQVTATFDTGVQAGNGHAQPLTTDTGYFWFFNVNNVEMVVKVLDACDLQGFNNFWVFAGGLTDVEMTLTVVDTESGQMKEYRNPPATPFQPIQDQNAFATCP